MLAFTEEQLAQIGAAAAPVPWALREAYLERIATLLSGRQFSNCDVQRAAAQVQRELIGVYGMTRADRFLARVDNELADMEPAAREAFLFSRGFRIDARRPGRPPRMR
jgi:hypothetical protein